MKSTRAFIDPVTAVAIVAFGLGIVTGTWKPLGSLFGKKPPTQQLTELQAKLAEQQALAAQAAKNAEAAKLAERLKLEAQIRAAQQDNLGAATALKKVPAAFRTPEVNLADRMTQRVSLKLATAIGRLPQEEQDAMIELIEQALSDKQAEVEEANRKLAALDAQFKAVTVEREQLKAEIPKLTERATKAEETAKATQGEVNAKTEEVKTWANEAQAAKSQNGSLWSAIKKGALVMAGIYLFLAFGLPAIVKHMASGNPLKSVLRDVSGYTLNPLMHLDAKHKIKEALYTPVPPPTP